MLPRAVGWCLQCGRSPMGPRLPPTSPATLGSYRADRRRGEGLEVEVENLVFLMFFVRFVFALHSALFFFFFFFFSFFFPFSLCGTGKDVGWLDRRGLPASLPNPQSFN